MTTCYPFSSKLRQPLQQTRAAQNGSSCSPGHHKQGAQSSNGQPNYQGPLTNTWGTYARQFTPPNHQRSHQMYTQPNAAGEPMEWECEADKDNPFLRALEKEEPMEIDQVCTSTCVHFIAMAVVKGTRHINKLFGAKLTHVIMNK